MNISKEAQGDVNKSLGTEDTGPRWVLLVFQKAAGDSTAGILALGESFTDAAITAVVLGQFVGATSCWFDVSGPQEPECCSLVHQLPVLPRFSWTDGRITSE